MHSKNYGIELTAFAQNSHMPSYKLQKGALLHFPNTICTDNLPSQWVIPWSELLCKGYHLFLITNPSSAVTSCAALDK